MSGIYIPGMEMPTNCFECKLLDYTDTFRCRFRYESLVREHGINISRPDWCPLVLVPPHGRLGNLDDVINDVRHYLCEGCGDYMGPDAKTESCDYCGVTMLIKTIERKSSIIPADKEVEG